MDQIIETNIIETLQTKSMKAEPVERLRDGSMIMYLLKLDNYSVHAMKCLRINLNFSAEQLLRLSNSINNSTLYRRNLYAFSQQYDWELEIDLEHVIYMKYLRYLGKAKLQYE